MIKWIVWQFIIIIHMIMWVGRILWLITASTHSWHTHTVHYVCTIPLLSYQVYNTHTHTLLMSTNLFFPFLHSPEKLIKITKSPKILQVRQNKKSLMLKKPKTIKISSVLPAYKVKRWATLSVKCVNMSFSQTPKTDCQVMCSFGHRTIYPLGNTSFFFDQGPPIWECPKENAFFLGWFFGCTANWNME